MKDLVVIIPVHEYNKDIKPLLEDAINSVPSDIEIRISHAKGLEKNIKTAFKSHSNVVFYENKTDNNNFQTLVNNAIGDSKWFSILEFDDEYTKIWFDNVRKYIEFMPDVSIFLPLEDLVDFNTKKFNGNGNEAPWASAFSNEIGFIDNDCLQNFFEFYLTGGVFNTDDWNEIGGLKESMKITFWYEFLLRATDKGKKVYVIPKVGYNHYLGRPDSLIDSYQKTMTPDESKWWFDLARKEYHFKEDQNKTYENTEKKEEE